MNETSLQHLGPPSLKIEGFALWIHGRQFPDATDYWDANWLNVTAHCSAPNASVLVAGSILTAADIESFAEACEKMQKELKGEAVIAPAEPELHASLQVKDRLGHIEMIVAITPDNLHQKHEMKFDIDQSYLPQIIAQCRAILDAFSVKYPREQNRG